MKDQYIEMAPDLIAALAEVDKRIEEARDQVAAAEAKRRALLNEAASGAIEFDVGTHVMNGRQRYRITKIEAEPLSIKGVTPKLFIQYYGQRLKKDGTPTGRERWLYDIKPIREQS